MTPYMTSSKRARSLCALVAFVATVAVLGSIERLSQHYSAQGKLAGAATVSARA